MNPFEMVVAIVAIGAVASVFRAKYGIVRTGRGRDAREEIVGRPDPDAERLRDEVRALKERIAVLERIATDGSTSLDREIESLRDRP
jgi:hypothetical protein